MQFRKGNKIRYGQDCDQHIGLPHGIDFEVIDVIGGSGGRAVRLRAPGYGAKKDYGNGDLYAWGSYVLRRVRRETGLS